MVDRKTIKYREVLHMPTRRQVILATATLAGGTAAYTVGSFRRAANRYNEAVHNTWRHTPENSVIGLGVNRELVRYATLAASSHNTQCWKFGIEDQMISILPDWSRRCLLLTLMTIICL